MLQIGSKGQDVKELQEKLIIRGYSVGSYGADGDFGQGTHNAVIKFQNDHGLDADGIVGPNTMKAINGSISTKLLKKGDSGSAVKELQQILITKGYNVGSFGADGDFGQGTYDAVIKFQANNGLSSDGVVGPATWNALLGFSNGELLKLGSKGSEVKKLQEILISRGYSVGSFGADGDFGQGTYVAVIKFQNDNQLIADGIVGPATWSILTGETDNIILKLGSKGDNVRRLQEKLINRGYNVGPYGADGDFGQGTYNAVIKFQNNNGLSADGVVGQNTWYALNSLTGGILLFLGSNGPQVKKLQELLINRGYSVGSFGADGDFGQGTYNAVIKFQSDHGLSADGIVGPATWEVLNGNDNNYIPDIDGSNNVAKFLKIAISQIGYKETPVNITKYGSWYGMQDEWCAIFISWCANQSGILSTVIPRFHYCATGATWYKNRGRYRTRVSNYTPKPGDVIFFYNPFNLHPYYHVGIVEFTSEGKVHTVEGNTSNQVARRSYSLADVNIHGYGTNGGTTLNSNYEKILKEAGNKGLFTGTNTNFSGYNIETPMNILSLVPLITVRGKVTLRKTVEYGKVITLTSDAPRDLAISITNGLYSSGLTLDFTQENIIKTIQGINAGITLGNSLTYKIEQLPGMIVEATIEYKLPVTSGNNTNKNEVYQSIIIRIEQNIFMPMKLPVVATSSQESLVTHRRPIKVAESVETLLGLLVISAGAVIIISQAPALASLLGIFVLA